MAELFVVRLLGSAAVVDATTTGSHAEWMAEWVVFEPSGVRKSTVQFGTLAEAGAQALTRRVVVLVPGTEVLLAEPVLPLKGGAKLVQVVPFALEEQLATEVEDLHFAVGKRGNRPGTPVAAVAHTKMAAWLAALQDTGLQADAIYAETAVLPETANGVTLLVDDTRVYVKRENAPGAVLEVEPLIEALQLALASGEEAREHVTIYVNETDYERDRDLLEGLREFTASLQLKLMPDGLLSLLAANIDATAPVNLVQGRYGTTKKLNVSLAPWRYAAILVGVLFALHLGVKAGQLVHLKHTEARLDTEIAQVFQQALPGAPTPETLQARKQFEQRLIALRGSAPVSGMMLALDTLGAALAQSPGILIEALSYRDNVTDLRVVAPSVEALDRIEHVAREHGISAHIQSTSPRDTKVEGRLQFKSAGA
jgi:general secretion pathway protein L